MKQLGIAQLDEQVLRRGRRVPSDARAGQLREPDGQVDVCAREIDAPAPAVAAEVPAERGAAELETSIDVTNRRLADVTKTSPAEILAKLRVRRRRRCHGNEDKRETHPGVKHPHSSMSYSARCGQSETDGKAVSEAVKVGASASAALCIRRE